jgi:hypothetical protein
MNKLANNYSPIASLPSKRSESPILNTDTPWVLARSRNSPCAPESNPTILTQTSTITYSGSTILAQTPTTKHSGSTILEQTPTIKHSTACRLELEVLGFGAQGDNDGVVGRDEGVRAKREREWFNQSPVYLFQEGVSGEYLALHLFLVAVGGFLYTAQSSIRPKTSAATGAASPSYTSIERDMHIITDQFAPQRLTT